MSNIEVRRRNEGSALPAKLSRWEPFNWMRNVMGWDPFAEMTPAWPVEERVAGYLPPFEVKETPHAFVIKADVPGIKLEDLEISLTGTRLIISGKREAEKEEKDDRFYVYECSYGSFTRTFTLPDGVDAEHIRADLKDGILNLVLPKLPEVLPKKIGVNVEVKTKS